MGPERQAPTMAVWARKFATLLGVGVSLTRCLELLEETSEEPLREASRYLNDQVLSGEVLSKAMRARPQLFNSVCVSMVRAGEVGGVLDETLATWADWLERDLAFRSQLELYLAVAKAAGIQGTRAELEALLGRSVPDLAAQAGEVVFCTALAMMLGSGVPLIQALRVAAEARGEQPELGDRLEEAVRQPPHTLVPALEASGFSAPTCRLVAVGEETGQLERMVRKAADLLQGELNLRMSAALGRLLEECQAEEDRA